MFIVEAFTPEGKCISHQTTINDSIAIGFVQSAMDSDLLNGSEIHVSTHDGFIIANHIKLNDEWHSWKDYDELIEIKRAIKERV